MADVRTPDHQDTDPGGVQVRPVAGSGSYVADARGVSGMLVGDHGIQINYFSGVALADGPQGLSLDPAAQQSLITAYLKTLIAWLGTDPWPRDPQFGGPLLTSPTIERKLSMFSTGGIHDADTLALQCRRLVILGDPGSGKTWLARRIARRCAEDALAGLASGRTLDEIELPLYTTCSRLSGSSGHIREAVVSSSIYDLADLGGSQVVAAVQGFLAERNSPTVLVIDSLDEAHGPDDRLRQADTLPWRIILTTRRNSWRNQLTIDPPDETRQIGELQPLQYPADVEAVIRQWFAAEPGRGQHVAAEIARRPGLRQSATVPLILALYCILGGSEPIPAYRRDLYTRVLKRMLTGRWRHSGDYGPDLDVCVEILRIWAWTGAACHPHSHIGAWADEIPTERVRLSQADQDALGHVAAPLNPPDLDTGVTLRRFVHRSVREHLVAAHVASLTVDEAAQVLLRHIWHDTDWEYSAPEAVAQHPEHDGLLCNLIRRAARSDRVPGDLSVIDGGWELRRFLARVASESCEADWSPAMAQTIGDARVQLARSSRPGDLSLVAAATSWGTSNHRVVKEFLELLTDRAHHSVAVEQIVAVAQLATTAEDKRQVGEALLRRLADTSVRLMAGKRGHLSKSPSAEEQHHLRQVLLGLLNNPAEEDVTGQLVGEMARFATTSEEERQVREALQRALATPVSGLLAEELVRGVIRLATTTEDKRQAREALLRLLIKEHDHYVAEELVRGVIRLATTTEDKRQAREALQRELTKDPPSRVAEELADGVVRLATTAEDKRQAREALQQALASQVGSFVGKGLAGGIARLDPTAKDKRQARKTLLEKLTIHLPGGIAGDELMRGVVQLATTAEEKRETREKLLGLLCCQSDVWPAKSLVGWVVQLGPSAEEKRQMREVLLELLSRQDDAQQATPLADGVVQLGPFATSLVDWIIRLGPSTEEKRRTREALLGRLPRYTDGHVVAALAHAIVRFDPSAEDKRQVREALLGLLPPYADDHAVALALADVRLDPSAEDKRQAREALLGLLPRYTDGHVAEQLAHAISQLDPSAEDKRQARETLLVQLSLINKGKFANLKGDSLMGAIAQLDPTTHDLTDWRAWPIPPNDELLSMIRHNSELADWLAALPLLSPSGPPT